MVASFVCIGAITMVDYVKPCQTCIKLYKHISCASTFGYKVLLTFCVSIWFAKCPGNLGNSRWHVLRSNLELHSATNASYRCQLRMQEANTHANPASGCFLLLSNSNCLLKSTIIRKRKFCRNERGKWKGEITSLKCRKDGTGTWVIISSRAVVTHVTFWIVPSVQWLRARCSHHWLPQNQGYHNPLVMSK